MIGSEEEVKKLELAQKQEIIILTQTTFNVSKIKSIIEVIKDRFDNVIEPADQDICYATTNRQNAIAELAQRVDLVLVVGSKESSNSNRLVEVAKENGAEARLLDSVEEIGEEWLNNKKIIGLSAGASAPEYRVQEIIDYFQSRGAKREELKGIKENVNFSEPIELKKARVEKDNSNNNDRS